MYKPGLEGRPACVAGNATRTTPQDPAASEPVVALGAAEVVQVVRTEIPQCKTTVNGSVSPDGTPRLASRSDQALRSVRRLRSESTVTAAPIARNGRSGTWKLLG